jgi:hypothetical protein
MAAGSKTLMIVTYLNASVAVRSELQNTLGHDLIPFWKRLLSDTYQSNLATSVNTMD